MGYFNSEPPYKHGDPPRIGIILANLGTPDAPNASSLRRYLGQFLMDRRVVEIPRFIWCWILHFIILVFRPKASAKKYAQVWTSKGSPLLVNARLQETLLKKLLKNKYQEPIEVALGMSYGNPSMSSALNELRKKNCNKILLFPLYPQYAASSSGSAMDALWKILIRTRNVPEIRTIRHYHDNSAYINALKISVLDFWKKNGKPKKLVMSFHGVPKKSLMQGDPYHCECHKTGRLLAKALRLKDHEYEVCFQSRFGKAEWLKPYFTDVIAQEAKKKDSIIHVICPGFSSDCLETLEEINMEGKELFLDGGGKSFHYIPALNKNSVWINSMEEIVRPHLIGWVNPKWAQKKEDSISAETKKMYSKVKDNSK